MEGRREHRGRKERGKWLGEKDESVENERSFSLKDEQSKTKKGKKHDEVCAVIVS